ncbi:hypothetical protein P2C69_19800, partial [Xanthomonas perforans]
MSAPRPASDRHIVLRLPRHTLKIAGIAFAAGLLLFLLVWISPGPERPCPFASQEPDDAPRHRERCRPSSAAALSKSSTL